MSGALARLRRKAAHAFRVTLEALPDVLSVWFRPSSRRFALADVPAAVGAPNARIRLYVAPANFAAQGYALARAVEGLSDVGAVNMQPRAAHDFGFPADYSVPQSVFSSSGTWARRQREAVAAGFTHLLVEAERPLFGVAFGGVVEQEIRWLEEQGLKVALFSHGTDLRVPSQHAQYDEWSPFRNADLNPDWVRRLEQTALRNRALGDRLGVPLFVATPELLLQWPSAQWLPNVVDVTRWKGEREIFGEHVPVVLHAPTNPLVKGTALIEPVVQALAEQGVIDYRRVMQVPAAEMPRWYESADIVLDQFALGIYSTTSLEAMAAGRIVIAHLNAQVREHVNAVTGLEPPIVEATPHTLEVVIRDIVSRPDHYRLVASRGPEFVAAVHDGTLSARVLAPFLGVSAPEQGRTT